VKLEKIVLLSSIFSVPLDHFCILSNMPFLPLCSIKSHSTVQTEQNKQPSENHFKLHKNNNIIITGREIELWLDLLWLRTRIFVSFIKLYSPSKTLISADFEDIVPFANYHKLSSWIYNVVYIQGGLTVRCWNSHALRIFVATLGKIPRFFWFFLPLESSSSSPVPSPLPILVLLALPGIKQR
jgi:hypothetical protein